MYRDPRCVLENVTHFGQVLEISRPLITVAAKMLYISRREVVPFAIPPNLPVDRAQALALGRTQVGPTQADVHEFNAHQSVKLVQRQPWNYWEIMSEEGKTDIDPDTRTLSSASAKWDNDWNRMNFCVDPWHKIPLKGMTYTYGMLDGLWQGRMMVNNPSSLGQAAFLTNLLFKVPVQSVLLGLTIIPHLPSSFGEGNPQLTISPLFMRLREHRCINPYAHVATGGKRDGFDDGLANAWLPVTRIIENQARLPYSSS